MGFIEIFLNFLTILEELNFVENGKNIWKKCKKKCISSLRASFEVEKLYFL